MAVTAAAVIFAISNISTCSQASSARQQITNEESTISALTKENETLQTKLNNTQTELKRVREENEELKYGAAAQLVEIKNAFEEGNWQKTVSGYKTLHSQYNGTPEDEEAKKLADQAQQKIDEAKKQKEEEEKKKKEEEQKKKEAEEQVRKELYNIKIRIP